MGVRFPLLRIGIFMRLLNLYISLSLITILVLVTSISPDGLPSSLLIRWGFSIPFSFAFSSTFLAVVVVFVIASIWGVMKSGENS